MKKHYSICSLYCAFKIFFTYCESLCMNYYIKSGVAIALLSTYRQLGAITIFCRVSDAHAVPKEMYGKFGVFRLNVMKRNIWYIEQLLLQ